MLGKNFRGCFNQSKFGQIFIEGAKTDNFNENIKINIFPPNSKMKE
jgi:hypothetical protein